MVPKIDCGESATKREVQLLKGCLDPTAVCNTGQYISVDSRPVSCARGILKQIIQLFKSYLRSSLTSANEHKINDPFLCMNLVCPPGSYDANVEPAKDDVLFTDSSHVLQLVETFLKSQYGELANKEKRTSQSRPPTSHPRAFDLLLAKKPPPAAKSLSILDMQQRDDLASIQDNLTDQSSSEVAIPDITATTLELQSNGRANGQSENFQDCNAIDVSDTVGASSMNTPISKEQTWHHSMYPTNEDYASGDAPAGSNSQDSEEEKDLRDIRISNPWALAKLNAPVLSQKQYMDHTSSVSRNQQLLTPAKTDLHPQANPSSPLHDQVDSNSGLPSPLKSQNGTAHAPSSPDTFPYPIRRWGKGQREANHRERRESGEEPPSSSILDSWVQRTPASQEPLLSEHDVQYARPRRDFVQASKLPQGTPLSAIPDISQRPARRPGPRKQQQPPNLNKPFKPPVRDPQHVWFDHLTPSQPRMKNPSKKPDASLPANYPHAPDLQTDPIASYPPPSPAIYHHPGLAATMDYEARKAAATAQRRAFLRQQHQSKLNTSSQQSTQIKVSASQQEQANSPHRNRYRSAIAALRPTTSEETPPMANADDDLNKSDVPPLDPNDPRAHLIRILNPSFQGRVQQGKLPLESVSEDG
ncbi:MAG: hypothetical protein Q9222_006712, partial [Ikaeria aurantiellina]